MIIVNGKEMSLNELKKINPNAIELIELNKDENKIKYYGTKAKHGILTIQAKIGC